MRQRLLSFWLAASYTAFSGLAQADKPHPLAYSPKLDVEVLAEIIAGKWCRENLVLQIIAKEDRLFQGIGVQTLMDKLGIVLKKECPAAGQAEIKGYVAGSPRPVYRAFANKATDWTLAPEKPVGDELGQHVDEAAQISLSREPMPTVSMINANGCKIKIQGQWVFFSVYQPLADPRKAFCKNIPKLNIPANMVFDYTEINLKHMRAELEITKEPEGKRVYYQAADKRQTATVNTTIDFNEKGAYRLQVKLTPEKGAPFSTEISLSVGK